MRQEQDPAAGIHPKSVAYWERMPGELPEAASGAPRNNREAFARHGVAIEGHVVRFHMVDNCWL